MRKYTFLLTALFSGLFFTSCGGDPSRDEAHEEVVQAERADGDHIPGVDTYENEEREIEIVADNMNFQPAEIRVKPGQKLSVALLNQGDTEHSLEFHLPDGEVALLNPVPPAQSEIIEFYAPEEPGSYLYYCPVGDHRERGMTGQLIVEE